jgi:hypothetical protein
LQRLMYSKKKRISNINHQIFLQSRLKVDWKGVVFRDMGGGSSLFRKLLCLEAIDLSPSL